MEVSVDCAKHPQLGEFPPIPLGQVSQVQRSGFQSLTRRTIAFAIGAVTCGAVCPVHFLAGRSGRPPDWRLLDNGPALVLRHSTAVANVNSIHLWNIAVFSVQNSSRIWRAIMRGALSPPRPTPSSPVGGDVV